MGPMSQLGLGRVKTPTFDLRVEIPSRFRKFENQKCLRPLLREDDRENNSAHSWLVHVFTQPGSFASFLASADGFRSSLGSGHRHGRSACLKSATSGLMHRSKEQATDHRSFWVDAFLAQGGSQKLHQFQSAAIRTEAALAAGASGRKPVPYPAAGDSLWRERVAGHTPCRRAPCIADLSAMRETPPDHRSRAQSAPAAAYPHRATGQSPRHPCCSDPRYPTAFASTHRGSKARSQGYFARPAS